MLRALTLVVCGLLAPAPSSAPWGFAPADAETPLASGATVVRSEHFVLEDSDGTLAGFAVWRRREGPRGVQLERELRFRSPDEPGVEPGLYHVECLERGGSRLVQRETGSGGRALLAELTQPDGSLRAYEWGPCGSRQEVLALRETAALPLYLAELARSGRFAAGRVGCFDPVARAVVDVEATTSYATDGSPGRTTELRRADGTLVLELRFEGTDLLGFRLQDGGPWARRIEADTYASLRDSGASANPPGR
ncbi:MAG: hypothetical protein NTY35_11745 [Planctomycetota bacterium]|nr:hypothetical protein [Planctomycetota bacterium]